MTVKTNLFPGGVRRALTMSYDDGQLFDVRLAALFDKYHIRNRCWHSCTATMRFPYIR